MRGDVGVAGNDDQEERKTIIQARIETERARVEMRQNSMRRTGNPRQVDQREERTVRYSAAEDGDGSAGSTGVGGGKWFLMCGGVCSFLSKAQAVVSLASELLAH